MSPKEASPADNDDATTATAATARTSNSVQSGGDANKNADAQRRPNLVDKLGGPEKLICLMDEFYAGVIVDPMLTKFFQNADMLKLKRHSLNIIATAFAPAPAAGDEGEAMDVPAFLSKTHSRLFEQRGVSEVHFDRFVGLFAETMKNLDIDPETRGEAEGKLRRFRCVFEEGAARAASKKLKRKNSKVRFSEGEGGSFFFFSAMSSSERKKYVAGACVVVGAIAASCVVLRRRRS